MKKRCVQKCDCEKEEEESEEEVEEFDEGEKESARVYFCKQSHNRVFVFG